MSFQNLEVGDNLINGYSNETLLHGNTVPINGYANDGFGISNQNLEVGDDLINVYANETLLHGNTVPINVYANDSFGI